MSEIKREYFVGERALFKAHDLVISECTFADGESPLKEGRNLTLDNCLFKWRYPLWYCRGVKVDSCTFFEDARAGIWYTDDVEIRNSTLLFPKSLRRCKNMTLENVTIPKASETLWACEGVNAKNIDVTGEYFAMNSSDLTIDNLNLAGKYSFDGVKNVVIDHSRLVTKDCFWNSENVTVKNSFVTAEYIGWNSKNMTFENCTLESLQGFCYIENLKLVNCRLINTNLAFEYSTVDADIVGTIDSVKNPRSGRIVCDGIGELIMEESEVDPKKTEIIIRK